MPQSYFSWNGVDCRSMGIIMRGPAPIIRAEERASHIQIPGRSGDLTQIEGEDIYNSYIQTVTISVKGGYRVREVYKWLRGDGYVTFSGEPDRKQKARIIGAITLDRVSRNMDHWAGDVQFYCQPLKEKLIEPSISLTSNNKVIINEGDVVAKPLYRVTVSSTSFSLAATGTGTPAQNSITVTGLTSNKTYLVDSETMEVTRGENSYTKNSTGSFPVLSPGENIITFTNVSEVEIEKRERFL